MEHEDLVTLTQGRLRNAVSSQPAIAASRVNGRHMLLLSFGEDAKPLAKQKGCTVLEIADLATAQLKRDQNGVPIVLAEITGPTGPNSVHGPAQCDYDPASETGVIMTLMREDKSLDPQDLYISLHATGVHP